MSQTQFINEYANKLIQKISSFQQQWKGTRFATVQDSTLDPQQDNQQVQYEQILEKYRGKNGAIKPLGLLLFHKYLSSLFFIFLALSLLFVPIAIVYSFGGGLSQFRTTSSISKSMLIFSIANLPRYRLDDISQQQISQIRLHRWLTISTDIIGVFVIFIFSIYFKVVAARITSQYMAKSPSPNLYCLEVQNINGVSETQIKNHFQKLGKVSQVSAVFTYKDTIYQLRKIVKLTSHLCYLKPDEKQYEECIQKIYTKYKSLAKIYLQSPKPQIKSVFICFQEIQTRNRVHDLYQYNINPDKLCLEPASSALINKDQLSAQKCNQSQDKNNQNLQQKTNNKQKSVTKPQLIVKLCNCQPLTVNWQNCDIDKKSQAIKSICQFLLLVVVAFVILLGLFLVNINSSHVRETIISDQKTVNNFQKNFVNETKEKYTFCASLTLTDFKLQYYELCSEYLSFQRNRFALMITFALMVAIINLLTNRILWALVAFRRYRTTVQKNRFLVVSISMFSLINSAVLILFIRGHYTGPILRKIVSFLLNFDEQLLQVTVYSQFNRNWYMNIGAQLMMNYIVSLIIFPNFHIVLHWVRSKYRQIKAKNTRKPIKKPVLNYCTFYAMSLKSIFFALIYSNCMPVFYLLCCVALLIQIGVVNLLLNKFVDQPVFVDNNAIQLPMNIIPYAILIHCCTSVIFLNVQQIFPMEDSYDNMHTGWLEINLLKVQRGYIYIFIFILVCFYTWNRTVIDQAILKFMRNSNTNRVQCDRKKKFRELKNNPAFLASYKMKDNPKYKILFYALQLFCSHMQKIRQKTQQKNEKNDLNVSQIFEQESMMKNLKNMSSLKNVNQTATQQDQNMNKVIQNQVIYTQQIIKSEVWSEVTEEHQHSQRQYEIKQLNKKNKKQQNTQQSQI